MLSGGYLQGQEGRQGAERKQRGKGGLGCNLGVLRVTSGVIVLDSCMSEVGRL